MKSTRRVRLTALLLGAGLPVLAGTAVPHSAWSAQSTVSNGRIAFATQGPHSQIYTVNPDGTDERQLTSETGGVQVDMPDWSPGGSRIAYVSNKSGSFDLLEMNADGTGKHLIAHTDGWDYYQPRWSPNGTWFAVIRCNEQFGYCDLDVMKTDGTGRHAVVAGHVHNADPSWSPDGTEIAFSSDRAGLVSAIWVVDLTTHHLRRLTKAALEGCYPSWSPLGTWVIFQTSCDDAPVTSHVFAIRASGGRAHQVGPEPPTKATGVASYSPDGRRILFLVDRDNGSALFTMTADGRNVRPVVTDHPHVFFTDWGTNNSTATANR